MIGGLVTRVLAFIITLPFRILLSFRFSAIFTLIGFVLGLLSGILAGYYFFIYPEPSDAREVRLTDLSDGKELTPEQKKRFFKLLPPWVHSPDFERISWFNKMMQLMWPFIDKAVAAEVLAQATPLIAASKPSFVESIDFDSLTLGPLPPSFIGIKSFQTMEDEVIIQPELRWCGRPNVKVVARIFGMAFSAHITHIYLQAPVRITLKPLSNYFPCFSKIVVSLMSTPTVDLGLSILGLDPLVFPLVNNLLEAQVEAAVADQYLWPQAMKIYDDEPKPVIGKLIIRHIRGLDLRNVAGLVSTIDPLVRVGFGKKVGNFQTAKQKDTTDPIWDEEGAVSMREGNDELLVEVFHWKKPKHVLIGAAWLPLTQAIGQPGRPVPVKVTLKETLATPGSAATTPTSQAGQAPLEKRPSLLRKMSTKKPKEPRDTGTLSFSLEFQPRKVVEGKVGDDSDDEAEEEEIVVDEATPPGGGKLWVKLRSGRELEAKKSGYDHPIVFVKFQGKELKSDRYKEPDVDMFNDVPFTWDCDRKPDKESLIVRVVAESRGATLSKIKRFVPGQGQDTVGHVEIPLKDAVNNGRLLDDFSLVGSKGASLKIEIRWKGKPEKPTLDPSIMAA